MFFLLLKDKIPRLCSRPNSQYKQLFNRSLEELKEKIAMMITSRKGESKVEPDEDKQKELDTLNLL